jgi:hypothetical protein
MCALIACTYILNAAGNQVGISGQASHAEDVSDIVHHDIHS